MTFTDSIRTCFNKYALFEGRATRSEFWWFALFSAAAGIVLGCIQPFLGMVFNLAMVLPWAAVAARRLHDTGRSGWWQLIGLIPLIGVIVLIVFCAQDGQPDSNEYGAAPLKTPS